MKLKKCFKNFQFFFHETNFFFRFSDSTDTERIPKQDNSLGSDENYEIGLRQNQGLDLDATDNDEDDSINFDEFFDLAVLKNDLLSSHASKRHTSNSLMLLLVLFTSYRLTLRLFFT